MSSQRVTDGRLICAKHRWYGPLVGPVVFADDLVVGEHRPGECF